MPTKRRKGAPRLTIIDNDDGKGTGMVRRSHYANPPVVGQGEPLTPQALTKQEFGRRLQSILNDRGWSQSDFVREINRQYPDLDRPFGRDAISKYINGLSFPTPRSLTLMHMVLGISREELLPNALMNATNDEHPALELKMAAGQPGRAWVKVNRLLTFDTASKIVTLINDEDKRAAEAE